MNTSLIDKIIALAHADDDIRAIILEGSFAAHFQVDELSDYDVNIYALNYEKYLLDDRWMSQIGQVLLYQKEQFQFYAAVVPTRLVLFRDRERVDFSFWHLTLLSEIVRGDKEYESYKNGYQILVDKDHLAAQLRPPNGTGFSIARPGRERFLQTLYDFWFEAYCVARYLSRRDLWYAKRIEDSYIKDHLFRMALWHHQAANEWKPDPLLHTEGKRFEKWASPELIAAISRCFSPYEVDGTWNSLFAMVGVFNQLARQTSNQLQIEYPDRVERDIGEYLQYLKSRPGNREDKSR
jgi:aminoglycoside 6-adenylyltransferase